ncbi:MAG: hypothetical protein N4A72_11015 [Bacteroidales bacterium]|jgi:hypothetical protein|nr:hypothetical protein [Bacteroidales bacterium]
MKISKYVIFPLEIVLITVLSISFFSEHVLFDYILAVLMIGLLIFRIIRYFKERSTSNMEFDKKIRLSHETRVNKKFWIWMLIVWSFLAIIGYLHDYDNIMICYVNVFISVNWLLFNDTSKQFLFCDDRGRWNIKFEDKIECFDEIIGYRQESKRIVINTIRGEIKLPKYEKVFENRLMAILDREVEIRQFNIR